DVEELTEVLVEDIWSDISENSYTRSAPVVSRLLEEGDELKIYYAYFDHPVWRGHLKAYNLNEDGTYGDPISGWTSSCDEDLEADADAGCEIASQSNRTIYTMGNRGTRIIFNPRHELQSLVNPDGEDIDGNGVVNAADSTKVVHYTLNSGFDKGEYAGTRDPDWPLGDIYNSVPVVVTEPKFNICYKKGYCDTVDDDNVTHDGFKTTYASRDTIIYVGANDGMLHAINESNGQEKWGWIPRCVLGTLHEFKDGHRFTVDLSVKAADIDLSDNCTGTGWKTVLVEGLRKGGSHYFALDVTDPDNPQPMWEITDDNMGKTWSVPSFGCIDINGMATNIVFVGGGYSTTENKGNRVYILKAGTGEILSEIEVGGAANNVPSQILAMRYLLNEKGEPVDYVNREKVDSKLKGFIEVAYFGDTSGTLYKITGLNADSGWSPQAEMLYKPENQQPIYHKPAVAEVYKDCTRRFVLFGTGDENDPIDGSSQDYFYEIEDRAFDDSEGGPDEYSLWTEGQKADGLFRKTWMFTLPLGEKMFADPVTYRDVVYFTTYQPQGGCAMGFSYLYGLTTTRCGSEGGEGGLEYGLDGNSLDPHKGKLDLGIGIATSPVIAPPMMYIQIPRGKGGDLEPPMAIRIPIDPGTLLYWREEGYN
ncbi:MAG: PilC/PilY family type IV pilus protein, partial [Thermodesulfobacteriota bacterium]|nr:PilC/PilY family type IV pilus protein [Thermodesulfobacteriota bacterium]